MKWEPHTPCSFVVILLGYLHSQDLDHWSPWSYWLICWGQHTKSNSWKCACQSVYRLFFTYLIFSFSICTFVTKSTQTPKLRWSSPPSRLLSRIPQLASGAANQVVHALFWTAVGISIFLSRNYGLPICKLQSSPTVLANTHTSKSKTPTSRSWRGCSTFWPKAKSPTQNTWTQPSNYWCQRVAWTQSWCYKWSSILSPGLCLYLVTRNEVDIKSPAPNLTQLASITRTSSTSKVSGVLS